MSSNMYSGLSHFLQTKASGKQMRQLHRRRSRSCLNETRFQCDLFCIISASKIAFTVSDCDVVISLCLLWEEYDQTGMFGFLTIELDWTQLAILLLRNVVTGSQKGLSGFRINDVLPVKEIWVGHVGTWFHDVSWCLNRNVRLGGDSCWYRRPGAMGCKGLLNSVSSIIFLYCLCHLYHLQSMCCFLFQGPTILLRRDGKCFQEGARSWGARAHPKFRKSKLF